MSGHAYTPTMGSSSSKSTEIVEYESSDSESDSDDEDSEEVSTSILTQLSIRFSPTISWSFAKMGTFVFNTLPLVHDKTRYEKILD